MKRTGFIARGKPFKVQARHRMKAQHRIKKRYGKPKHRKSAKGPMLDPAYKAGVKALPCCCCRASGPSDIHHCKDRPPADMDVYRYFPGYGETSADYDGIPLCRRCHDVYHRDKAEVHRLYGFDYQYIPLARALVFPMEIGF